MQRKPVTVIYQMEVTDSSILLAKEEMQNDTEERSSQKSFLVEAKDTPKLKVELVVIPGVIVYATDDFAKQNSAPTTMNLINHSELTNNHQSCAIL